MKKTICIICECKDRDLIKKEDIEFISDSIIHNDKAAAVLKSPNLCNKTYGIPLLNALAASHNQVIIVGCHERAQKWLFKSVNDPHKLAHVSLRVSKRESALESISELTESFKDAGAVWFPVIDKNLCTNCGHCMEFCLFGVYKRSDTNEIEAAYPENCKDNCPACARVCPEGAIIFPKCTEEWIAGADVPKEPYRKMTIEEIMSEIVKKKQINAGNLKDIPNMIKSFSGND